MLIHFWDELGKQQDKHVHIEALLQSHAMGLKCDYRFKLFIFELFHHKILILVVNIYVLV